MILTTRHTDGGALMGTVLRVTALAIALLMALHLQTAAAQQSRSDATMPDAAELMGVPVFAADGPEVGEVSAVAMMVDGTITEIRVTTASPLGLGTRTVVLPGGRYVLLRGAIIVDLSAGEFDGLPTAPGSRR